MPIGAEAVNPLTVSRSSQQNALCLIACGVGVAILLLGWCVCRALDARAPAAVADDGRPFTGPFEINRWHQVIISHGNSTGQRTAHRMMVALFAGLCLGGAFWRPRSRVLTWICTAILIAGAAFFFTYWWKSSFDTKVLAGSSAIILTMMAVGKLIARRPWNQLFFVLTLLCFVASFAPAIAAPVDLSAEDWDAIELYQMHYSVTATAGERWAAGNKLFETVTPYYGLIYPFCVASWTRVFGEPSISASVGYFRWAQAVFVAILIAGYFLYSKRRWPIAFVPALFAIALYHFNHHLILFPNHNAIRHASAAIIPLSMLISARWPGRNAVPFLAMVSGLCTLINPETGVAFSIGLLAYLVRRFARIPEAGWIRRVVACVLSIPLGILIAMCGFSIAGFLVQGSWLPVDWPNRYLFTLFFISSTGYSAMPFHFHAFAIVMFLHAGVVVIQGFWGPATFRSAFRLAIATMILVWYAYFANRPQGEKLFSHTMLYGFLVVDVLRGLSFFRSRRVAGLPAIFGGLALAIAYLPYAASRVAVEWPYYQKGIVEITKKHDTYLPACGAKLPIGDRTAQLLSKAEQLQERAKSGPVAYFTLDAYFIPKISEVWSIAPFADTMWESINRDQYEKLFAWIRDYGPEEILTDGPLAPNAGGRVGEVRRVYVVPAFAKAQRDFYEHFRSDLARHYEPVEQGDWIVWKKRHQ